MSVSYIGCYQWYSRFNKQPRRKLIWGENENKLAERTIKVLESCKKHGLKLHTKKCKFDTACIIFLGSRITLEKIAAYSKMIYGIKNIPNPSIILLNLYLICLTIYTIKENFG